MTRYLALPALLLSLPLWGAPPPDKVKPIVDCMRANVPSVVRVQQIELATFDRGGGTREMRGRLFVTREPQRDGPGLIRAMLRVDGPASLAGGAYLMRELKDDADEGIYMYLPAMKRVRRVTGTFAKGGLMGTDFSYQDFKDFASAFGDLTPRLEVPETYESRPVHVLTFARQGRDAEPTRYRSVRVWVDPATCVALKADFHEGGAPRKRLTSDPRALRQSGKYWYLSEVQMRDLKDGTRTVLRVNNVSEGEPLASRYFNPNMFYEGN